MNRYGGSLDLGADESDLQIRCDYDGYNDPGVCSGPPENCYPPEGETNITNLCVIVFEEVNLAPDIDDAALIKAAKRILAIAETRATEAAEKEAGDED